MNPDYEKTVSDLTRYLNKENGSTYEQQLVGKALTVIHDLQLKVMSLEAACRAGDRFLVVQAQELARLKAEAQNGFQGTTDSGVADPAGREGQADT